MDPFAYHDALRDLGSVFWIEAYECYGMAQYAPVQAALLDWETCVSARSVGLTDFPKKAHGAHPHCCLRLIRRYTTAHVV